MISSPWFRLGFALAFVHGCAGEVTEATATDTGESGISPTLPDDTSGAPPTSTTDVTDSADTTTTPESSSSESGCDGEPNACGGCSMLPETIGDPCGGCDDLMWTCDGTDAAVCDGFDPDATRWFPDADGDGFGDADSDGILTCEEPPAGSVENDDDCDDGDIAINPDGTEVCNGVDDDCDDDIDEGPSEFCDDVCCSFELACDGVACEPKCDGTEICGADLDTCCAVGEICFAETCVVPGASCEFTEECPVGQECAQATGQCVPEDVVPECEYVPPVGEFSPEVGCQSSTVGLSSALRDDVVATPIVIDVTSDGIPDIATLTYDLEGDGCCNSDATIRIYSGQCQDDGTMLHIADLDQTLIAAFNGTAYTITNDSGIAAGDLDGDGVAEIVAITKTSTANNNVQGTVAFRRTAADGSTWDVLWHNVTYPTWNVHTRGGAAISIADLDADGSAEVIVGNVALNGQDGSLLWDGNVTAGAFTGGIGNNGFLGPTSAVADIDLDGMLEVSAGNTVYEHDGTVKWEYTYVGDNSPCGASGAIICDGFSAIANFDDDDEGEVAIVRRGEVFLLDDDGTELRRMQIPSIDCANNEAGPPTIADFDGDGRPEIGTASADYYVVVDWDCDPAALPIECAGPWVLWQATNQDCSSRVTGSSVFDFEGDGAAEVVYADETTMRIFDGSTGAVLFTDDSHNSHTRLEMPVIADVDDDGNAEVVIPENGTNTGIVVWEDTSDNWVRTRRVWNQHAYHITHITESGSVPAVPEVNWLNERFNNFRQNVQPDGLFHAPDAAIEGSICEVSETRGGYEIDLTVLVRNLGALSIPAGTPVDIVLVDGVDLTLLGSTATSITLQPGQFEVIALTLAMPMGVAPPYLVRAIVDPPSLDAPAGEINECNEDNNAFDTECVVPG